MLINPTTILGLSILIAAGLLITLSEASFVRTMAPNNPLIGLQLHENYSLYLSVTVMAAMGLVILGSTSTVSKLKNPYAKNAYSTMGNPTYHSYSPAFETYHHRGETISNIHGVE